MNHRTIVRVFHLRNATELYCGNCEFIDYTNGFKCKQYNKELFTESSIPLRLKECIIDDIFEEEI
jgi:hypothetical protein